jgi:histone-lysine N-methyltransferase SETMAR
MDDRRWTVTELAQHTGIPASTVRRILRQDLKMRKIAAKWVPHHLHETQKWTRYETCCINLERFHQEGNGMLNRIIAIDETWARAYEIEATVE